jgi:hypothetical protein
MQGTGPALESLATYDTLVSWARGFEVLATSRNATLHSWQAALWALDCGLSTPPPPTAPPDAFAEFSLPEPPGTFFVRAPRHPLCAAIAFALLWHRADRGRNVSSAAAARRISCAEVAGSAAPAEPRRAGAVPGLDVEQEAHLSRECPAAHSRLSARPGASHALLRLDAATALAVCALLCTSPLCSVLRESPVWEYGCQGSGIVATGGGSLL